MNRSPFRSHPQPARRSALVALVACGGGGDDDDSAANLPPTVTLTAPATGTTGVAMTLTATAADSDDTVAKVEFFDGATLLGEDTTSPYSLALDADQHRRAQPHRPRHRFARRRDDQHRGERDGRVRRRAPTPRAPTATLTAPADLATGLTGMLVALRHGQPTTSP